MLFVAQRQKTLANVTNYEPNYILHFKVILLHGLTTFVVREISTFIGGYLNKCTLVSLL